MIFTIVIVLIVVLIVAAIFINALQQHKEQVEAEKRTEHAKQKSIVHETEDILMASAQIPVTQQLIYILHQRVLNALKLMLELNPKAIDIKQRIQDAADRTQAIKVEETPPAQESFILPDNEKQIIILIQCIKKLRSLLRSEHTKGKVDTQIFLKEDKRLDRLQLKVNVDTLEKRARAALQSNMLGSARQYFEKAIAALNAQVQQDEYTNKRKADLTEQLRVIQDNLRNANDKDAAKRQEEEKDELDELFAPKKKW